MRRRALALLAAAVLLALAGSDPLEAQSFFAGKTVRIVVGLAPGGGFDTYARLLARHLGRHIPGNPAIIVENMTGAGGLIAANHLAKQQRPRDVCQRETAAKTPVKIGAVAPGAPTDNSPRRLIQVGIQDGSAYSRPFIGPPGTPKDRVQMLRKAFVAALFALEPAFVDKLKSILHR